MSSISILCLNVVVKALPWSCDTPPLPSLPPAPAPSSPHCRTSPRPASAGPGISRPSPYCCHPPRVKLSVDNEDLLDIHQPPVVLHFRASPPHRHCWLPALSWPVLPEPYSRLLPALWRSEATKALWTVLTRSQHPEQTWHPALLLPPLHSRPGCGLGCWMERLVDTLHISDCEWFPQTVLCNSTVSYSYLSLFYRQLAELIASYQQFHSKLKVQCFPLTFGLVFSAVLWEESFQEALHLGMKGRFISTITMSLILNNFYHLFQSILNI